MAYQALYRAYRPQSFVEVAGQKHVIKTLQNAIKLNKVAHAYLFSGPRGTGKTTLAKILAKAINCKNGPSIEPCNNCDICCGITKGMISDVIEIDAASNNGVEEIRELRDNVKYMPSECKYKVYIIDEVHMLSNNAFNALLKTLEEPPAYVIFVLATTEPHKIPATILSRCQRFDFQSIGKDDIVSRVKLVSKSENVNVTDEAIDMISDICEGGMRDALSLLDQAISSSTDDVVDENDVLSVSGNVSGLDMLSLLKNLVESNGAAALKNVEQIVSKGKEIPKLVGDLILFIRDILLYKVGALVSLKSVYKSEEFISFCSSVNTRNLYSYLDILNDTFNNIKFTNQKKAYLELSILKMADKKLNDYDDLLRRIEILENKIVGYNEKPIIKEESLPTFERNPEVLRKISNETPINLPITEDVPVYDEKDITVLDITNVMNNAVKTMKPICQSNLVSNTSSDFQAEILRGGAIASVNQDVVIVVLQDVSKCNRIMRTYYEKALRIINGDNYQIKEMICVPADIWKRIQNEYLDLYKKGNTKPTLEEFSIPVKKHKIVEKKDNLIDGLKEMFDENLIKIEEE